jgi:hypothetical protein
VIWDTLQNPFCPTLAAMKVPWKRSSNGRPGIEKFGLDSVRFDTLGLTRESDEAPNERYWTRPGLVLSEHWFPIPPDMPSLKEEEIRAMYEEMLADQLEIDGRTARLLAVAVHRETPVPSISTLIRGVAPDGDRYFFIGAITLPLAECSWVIKAQSGEAGMTGVRESLAFVRFSKEQRLAGQSIEEIRSIFDPYDEQWDTDQYDEPLTSVRQSLKRIFASLEVDPEVLQAAPFRP